MLDFRGLVKILEERGELYRISRAVEPKFEMPAVMEQMQLAFQVCRILPGEARPFAIDAVAVGAVAGDAGGGQYSSGLGRARRPGNRRRQQRQRTTSKTDCRGHDDIHARKLRIVH